MRSNAQPRIQEAAGNRLLAVLVVICVWAPLTVAEVKSPMVEGQAVKPPAAGGKPVRPAGNLVARPAPKVAVPGPGAVVIPLQNCGTVHTGWVDVPGADVNPCPAACERGERVGSVDERKEGGKTQYYAVYRCQVPERVVDQRPEVARAIEAGGVKGTNCGTFWTGQLKELDEDANPCPASCERGELLDVRRSRSSDGSNAIYERWYRCYRAGTTNILATRVDLALPAREERIVLTTPPMRMTGTMLSIVEVAAHQFAAPIIALETPPMRMTGTMLSIAAVAAHEFAAPIIAITTPPMRMTGTMPMTRSGIAPQKAGVTIRTPEQSPR